MHMFGEIELRVRKILRNEL